MKNYYNKNGFTLVELLAVIVILAIILVIAVPGISNIISGASKSTFESDAKMVIKGVSYLAMNSPKYDVTSLNETNLESLAGVSSDNFSTVKVTNVKGDIKVVIVGKNKWANLVAYGTNKDMTVVNSSDFTGFADNSGASEPELANNMIPIMYYNGNWVKADKSNLVGTYSWYDYGTKKWANAVTVTSSTLNTYKNAAVGTVVNEADILTYLVWIPRYKYAIPAGTGARSINIVFEGKTVPKSTGTAIDTSYLTHPAFTFGTQELNGIWVGKFETGSITACTAAIGSVGTGCDLTTLGIQVKPNITSWRGARVSTFYTAIRNMKSNGNIYSFNANEVDTHMMLNSEWGAVAYLSLSTYGLNGKIYKNNSSGNYTGRSGGNIAGSQVLVGSNEYIDTGFYTYDGKCASTTTLAPGIDANCTSTGVAVSDASLSYNASTTGTIYGIYDMSGGAHDYVMGNYENYSGQNASNNSGFNGPYGEGGSLTTGVPFPDAKYYNLYATTDALTACNGGICYGHAFSEISGWYGDTFSMLNGKYPWFGRGSIFSSKSAGITRFVYVQGIAHSSNSTRLTVAIGF